MTLTKKQTDFLCLISRGLSPSEACKSLGLNIKTYWVWRRNSDFLRNIQEEARKTVADRMGPVYEVMLRKAMEGNVNAARYLSELQGDMHNPQSGFGPPAFLVSSSLLQII